MSMNFIEPERTELLSIDTVFETIPIQSKDKEWLCSLLPEKIHGKIQSDLVHSLGELVKKSGETGSNSFRALFLFDYNGILTNFSDCFDENKLSCERISALPELFTQNQDNKPVIFKAYVVYILDNIHHTEKTDSAFSAAYGKKKQEIREASSLAQRICCYIKLQNLPKRTYETEEKPATLDEISSLFSNMNEKYSMRLVAELEEIPEPRPESNLDAISFPFLLYGKELFNCVGNALYLRSLMQLPHTGNSDSLIQKIRIPQWNEKNYTHEIFFELAKVLKNMSVIDKIFEGIDSVKIPDVFFNYILYPSHSLFGVLLKGEYSNLIEPIRSEIEYLDWSLTAAIINERNPHKIYFERCQLFLDYLKYLDREVPDHKVALFRELSFLKHETHKSKIIRDVLDFIAQEREIIDSAGSSWTIPNQKQKADALYEEFIDVIAQGAASYPIATFLSFEQIQAIDNRYNYSKHEYKIFKRYCEKIELKTSGDALLIGQVWFIKFHGDPMTYLLNYKISDFTEKEEFFRKKIFEPFYDDEEFVCRFLSIPQEFSYKNKNVSEYWALYYIACWIVKFEKKPDDKDVFKVASSLLMREKIIFHEKIVSFILSNNEFDKLANKNNPFTDKINEADLMLYKVFAAVDKSDKYQKILETVHEPKELFSLYLIRYRYTHDEFVHQEFLDYLFALNKRVPRFFKNNEDEMYHLKIVKVACEEGILTKQAVLKKLSGYIINCKQRENFLASRELRSSLSYFMNMEKGEYQKDSVTAFITVFYERAIQETDPSCIELCTYLKIRSCSPDIADTVLFTDSTEQLEALKTRCGKMLRKFKSIEQEDLSEDERNLRYDCVWVAANFLFEKTGKAWKALKPLIVAFRTSKKALLTNNLYNHPLSRLPEMITVFFNIGDQKILKELMVDMANDFIDYFTPKDRGKTKQQTEQYTEFECKEEGFDLNLREPSPFWRYAYMRALADLGVKKDLNGHYFHKQLEKVSETDPSEDVKKAAGKTLKELDAMRLGIAGGNNKKKLYEAFWWLRYAHMLSLGEEVDNKKALELRINEWR